MLEEPMQQAQSDIRILSADVRLLPGITAEGQLAGAIHKVIMTINVQV